ncbi:MAG: L-histidine N(alpha)-methyltransferase [Chthoniobacterales bacterium]
MSHPPPPAVVPRDTAASDFRAELLAGLSRQPRTLPCKFFYDERGSELFLQISELAEYYITRTELALLHEQRRDIARHLGKGIQLIGLGTGAGTKTRLLLEELEEPATYIPVDISSEQLQRSAELFRGLFPDLEILPVAADYLQPFQIPVAIRQPTRRIVYFPGSTIGNFEPADAKDFLRRIVNILGADGGLLIGVDLRKSPEVLERAYNDGSGITAAFNLNLLARANRELQANFDLGCWRHRAMYNPTEGRIEMYLISEVPQTVLVAGQAFDFRAGEKITTEYSYKYSPDGFIALAQAAGLESQRIWTDDGQLFGLFYCAVPE